MGVKNFFVNEKAIIEILDLRELDDVVKKNVPASDGAPGGLASLTDNAFGNLDNDCIFDDPEELLLIFFTDDNVIFR